MDSDKIIQNLVTQCESERPEISLDNCQFSKVKFHRCIQDIANSLDGHLKNCMLYKMSDDPNETCQCQYYIHEYYKELLKEVVKSYHEHVSTSHDVFHDL